MIRLKAYRREIGEKTKTFYHRYGLKHFLPFAILIGYSVFGGLIFLLFEHRPDEERREKFLNALTGARTEFLETLHGLRRQFENKTANPSQGFRDADYCRNSQIKSKILQTKQLIVDHQSLIDDR